MHFGHWKENYLFPENVREVSYFCPVAKIILLGYLSLKSSRENVRKKQKSHFFKTKTANQKH